MPYWSSSKVGAVPPPPSSKKGQSKQSQQVSSKAATASRKGITLSDLKKQTALRLAKEQANADGSSSNRRSEFRDAEPPPYHHHTSTTHTAVPMPRYPDTNTSTVVPMPRYPDDARTFYPHNNHNYPNGYPSSSAPNNSPLVAMPAPQHPNPVMPVSMAPPPHSLPQQQPRYPPMESEYRVASPYHFAIPKPSQSADMATKGKKPKLPHGLTVHELKEMTKARLQAEASSEPQGRDLSQSPDPFAHLGARADVRDWPVPPPSYVRNIRSPVLDGPSPYYHHHPSPENWSHDSRNDVWEAGSVSTAASEYNLGPETKDEANRTRSFSAGPDFTGDAAPAAFYSNRHRAVTLSPRAGLSHLHEDRPVDLYTTRRPVAAQEHHHHHPLSDGANRVRSSSAASLPPMSHTAEEFFADRVSRFKSLPEQETVTGLTDVFASPETRTRASTWGETTSSPEVFGPGLIGNTTTAPDLGLSFLLNMSSDETPVDNSSARSDPWM